nr:CBS domain-containing protein [Microbacterium hydrocarbonoxydans]
MASTPSAPSEPTAASSLADTKKYFDYMRKRQETISVRDLIGYWGARGRGRNVVEMVTADLIKMGFEVDPPIDTGTLDTRVRIRNASASSQYADLDDHLLTLARIPAASFALANQDNPALPGLVEPSTPVDDATAMMLRYDYSQLLVVDDVTRRNLVGVVSWKSYGSARLRREEPLTVADIMLPATPVDLHSDLFSNVGPVVKYDFVAVTYQGKLAGIVTATDLTEQFEDLAVPFLAIGRCERELKRVARAKFAAVDPKEIDNAMLGRLQQMYVKHWDDLGWSISRDEFNAWIDSIRELRNKVAHFDDKDLDLRPAVRTVHQLAAWLRGVRTQSDSAAITDVSASEA